MSTDGKVLTFPGNKKQKETTEKDSAPNVVDAAVVDIGAKRQEMIMEERRSVKRTILTEFIGVHTVVPGAGLQRCTLHDISTNGIAFDLMKRQGHFQAGEEVVMRVYLNHKTYFGFTVSIRSCRFVKEDDVFRHGASLVAGSINQEAITHFIQFIESLSANLKTDHGDVIVSNLDQN